MRGSHAHGAGAGRYTRERMAGLLWLGFELGHDSTTGLARRAGLSQAPGDHAHNAAPGVQHG